MRVLKTPVSFAAPNPLGEVLPLAGRKLQAYMASIRKKQPIRNALV
jgi:hypothetical protein